MVSEPATVLPGDELRLVNRFIGTYPAGAKLSKVLSCFMLQPWLRENSGGRMRVFFGGSLVIQRVNVDYACLGCTVFGTLAQRLGLRVFL